MGAGRLLVLGASVAACSVSPLASVGRPCGPTSSCGPGARCDPETKTCVALPLDLAGSPDRPQALDAPQAERRPAEARLDSRAPDAPRPPDLRKPDLRPTVDQKLAKPDQPHPPDLPVVGPDAGDPCTAKYGSVAGYQLCSQSATSCVFYFGSTAGPLLTCQAICSGGGGSCIKAQNDTLNGCPPMTTGTAMTCATQNADAVCTCSK